MFKLLAVVFYGLFLTKLNGFVGNGGLSAGQAVGIVFGVLIALLVIGILGVVIYRRQTALSFASTGGLDNPSYSSSSGISFGIKPSNSSA